MQSYDNKTQKRSWEVGKVISTLALVCGALFALTSKVHALTLSLSKDAVHSTLGSVDQWEPFVSGNRVHIIYTTGSAAPYSIMLASQQVQSDYKLSLISTSAVRPLYLSVSHDNSTLIPHLYYYDSSSGTIKYINVVTNIGAPSTLPQDVGSAGSRIAQVTGVKSGIIGNHFAVLYSSKSAGSTYNLVVASIAVSAPTTVVTYYNVVSTNTGNVSGGIFNATTDENGALSIFYIDNSESALKWVRIRSGAVDENSRETIDSDSGLSGELAIGGGGNTIRVAYTYSGGVKLAVRRAQISPQCWYLQRIDDGKAQRVSSFFAGQAGVAVSYIKSDNLWAAVGDTSVSFFDDFTESITGRQQGKTKIDTSVSKGGLVNFPTGPLTGRYSMGIYQPSGSAGLKSIAAVTRTGNVYALGFYDGTNGNANAVLPSVRIKANPAGVADESDQGGMTTGSGYYQILVASGVALTVTPSSGSWKFFVAGSTLGAGDNVGDIDTFTSSATHTYGSESTNLESRAIDFVGVHNPTLRWIQPSSASVLTVNFNGAGEDHNIEFTIRSAGDTIFSTSNWTAGMTARLVPAGSVTSVTSTSPETNAIRLHLDAAGSGAADDPQTWTTAVASATWALFQSTNSATHGMASAVSYDLIVASNTKAGVVGAIFSNAFSLRPLEITVASITVEDFTFSFPGKNDVIKATSQVNTSRATTLILRSSSPYINLWNARAVKTGTVYLSTSQEPPANLDRHAGDIPLGVVAGPTADSYNGGSQFVLTSGSILGADYTKTWYVRITSRPATGQAHPTFPQSALSGGITFSSPAITDVYPKDESPGTAVVVSSGQFVQLNILGRGFIAGGGLFISSALPNSSTGAIPVAIVGGSSYTFQSSTWITVNISSFPGAAVGTNFHLFFTTGHVRYPWEDQSGGYPVGAANPLIGRPDGVVGSTVIAVYPNAISIATPAVTAIVTPSFEGRNVTLANTRSYTLILRGRGLRPGSTVQFYAIDGTTATNKVSATDVISTAAVSDLNRSSLTVTVDFRSPAFGGKTFAVLIATSPNFDNQAGNLPINSGHQIINSAVTVTVSSMSISSFDLPWSSTAGVYNSTGEVTIGIRGAGLIAGSTVSIGVTGSTPIIAAAADNGSNGAYLLFRTTGFFNTAAGSYNITVGTIVPCDIGCPAGGTIFGASTSAAITVLASELTSVSAVDETNYATLDRSSFTITAKGVQNGTLVSIRYKDDPGAAATSTGTLSTQWQSSSITFVGSAVFDLRFATRSGTYELCLTTTIFPPGLGTNQGRQHCKDVTINLLPTLLTWTSTSIVNNVANVLQISGRGLGQSSTFTATFSGSVIDSRIADTSASTAAFSGTITPIDAPGGDPVATTIGSTAGWRAQLTIPAGKMPGTWTLSIATTPAGVTYHGADRAVHAMIRQAAETLTFTVLESSAPNVPTGLTVISAGVNTVTLQWVSPGNDGTIRSLGSGAGFLVYYSSAADERGTGCGSCYPIVATTGTLPTNDSSFHFRNTWAHHLPYGALDGALTMASTNYSLGQRNPHFDGTSTVKGFVVNVVTAAVGDSALVKVVSTTTGETTAATSFSQGDIVRYTFNPNPNFAKTNRFWFVVRAFDEAKNTSRTDVYHTTVSAVISAGEIKGVPADSATGDVIIDPNKAGSAVITFKLDADGDGVDDTVSVTVDYDAGTFDSAGDLSKLITGETVPTAAKVSGVTTIGPALNFDSVPQPKKPLPIKMTVDTSKIPSGKKFNDLALLTYDVSKGKSLTRVPVSIPDSANNTVTGKVSGFSSFVVGIPAVPTNPSNVAIGPNPFNQSDATHRAAGGIRFDNLPNNTEIRIYTIAGDLVRELTTGGANGVTWNLRNDNGKDVTSGVYFAVLKGGGGTATAKVAVQR